MVAYLAVDKHAFSEGLMNYTFTTVIQCKQRHWRQMREDMKAISKTLFIWQLYDFRKDGSSFLKDNSFL